MLFCTEIDRQVQEIQAKRRKLNETATEQEKVQKMIWFVRLSKILLVRGISWHALFIQVAFGSMGHYDDMIYGSGGKGLYDTSIAANDDDEVGSK